MDDLVVFGVGELGKMFAGAALASGIRVTPITRRCTPSAVLDPLPPGTPVLLAVGEDALAAALDATPSARRHDLILLQNELWPRVWESRGFTPSVILPWVLQKRGLPRTVVGTSPCYGRHAPLLTRLCTGLGLPHGQLGDGALHQALAEKYAFILTINALGVWRDALLGTLLREAPERVQALCGDAAAIAATQLPDAVDATRCHARTVEAMTAMADVKARGRTALPRVERALWLAREAGLDTPTLRACLAG